MVNHQRHKKSTYHPTESLSLLICFSRGSDDFEYVNFCDPWEQLHRRKDPVTDLPQYPQSDPEPYCPPQSLRRTNKITQGPQHEYYPGYHANTPSGAYYSQPSAVVQAPLQGNSLPQHGNYRVPSHSYQQPQPVAGPSNAKYTIAASPPQHAQNRVPPTLTSNLRQFHSLD